MLRWETVKSRLRNSVDTQNKAGVFDGAARIDQSRSDCASLGPLYVLCHNRKPVGDDRFHVVVEKKKPWTVGVRDGIIFRCGIIRNICEIQHMMRRIRSGLSNFVALA